MKKLILKRIKNFLRNANLEDQRIILKENDERINVKFYIDERIKGGTLNMYLNIFEFLFVDNKNKVLALSNKEIYEGVNNEKAIETILNELPVLEKKLSVEDLKTYFDHPLEIIEQKGRLIKVKFLPTSSWTGDEFRGENNIRTMVHEKAKETYIIYRKDVNLGIFGDFDYTAKFVKNHPELFKELDYKTIIVNKEKFKKNN